MSPPDPTEPPTSVGPARRKRTDEIVDAIKRMIVEHGLGPGDRLPQERELLAQFSASKGTVREALKALEVQGLISVRTGPGGGAFIERMSERRAMSLLSNFLFAKNLSIANIYEMRKVLEPQLAASATLNIDEAGLGRLADIIRIYDHEPADAAERWNQRMAELDFHSVVAEYCDNPILAFTCRFLQRLLKDLTIAQDIYVQPEPVLRESGIRHQHDLIAAMRRRDATAASAILVEHMAEAEQHMLGLQARLRDQFLSEDEAPRRSRSRKRSA
ncbi:MAG TPA: FCD domain-containing protein [Devosia sp.]|jgi:DNA-binding FadR family transcriptional regulator|uniref:FadR/GntR family transcriptional regulator n=1 Tax=Devosia sp. TaxID=1871048 RepID=UPI002DDD04B4|nr:FCD domain-containing protein [Devosia sp.]HEV2515449.1 FCD domain-containing protein [Devosia sp.]